jgi:hypothetical protein
MRRWVNGSAKSCRPHENDFNCAYARAEWGSRRPSNSFGGLPILTRIRRQITAGFGLEPVEMERTGGLFYKEGRVQDLQMQPFDILGEYSPGGSRGGRGPCPRFGFWVKQRHVWGWGIKEAKQNDALSATINNDLM